MRSPAPLPFCRGGAYLLPPAMRFVACCLCVPLVAAAPATMPAQSPAAPAGHDGPAGAYLSARTGGEDRVRTGQFYFPRLQFQCRQDIPDKWDVHPIGDQRLREEVRKLTNINILTDPVVVNLDRPEEMCRYPFVFMTAEGDFVLPEPNVATLREYLLRGGFLAADDCVLWGRGDNFYKAFIREMARVFPDNPMRPVPKDHEIFSCYFKLDGAPHMQGVRHPPMGLFDKETGRLMAFLTSGDIHCGWVGYPQFGRNNIQAAIQMGVNVIVYCLTH